MSDSQFLKVFSGMIGGLIALTVVIFIIANNIGGKFNDKAISGANDTTVAERVKPVGTLVVAANSVMDSVIPAANADASKGKSVYDATCFACHGTGVAGSPKFGDKAAWKDRIAKGMATLDKHAIEGFQGKSGVMPAKGGNTSLSDEDVKAAVAYMVEHAK
jgi:cytochrome c5